MTTFHRPGRQRSNEHEIADLRRRVDILEREKRDGIFSYSVLDDPTAMVDIAVPNYGRLVELLISGVFATTARVPVLALRFGADDSANKHTWNTVTDDPEGMARHLWDDGPDKAFIALAMGHTGGSITMSLRSHIYYPSAIEGGISDPVATSVQLHTHGTISRVGITKTMHVNGAGEYRGTGAWDQFTIALSSAFWDSGAGTNTIDSDSDFGETFDLPAGTTILARMLL